MSFFGTLFQIKIETEARFLAKRPQGLLATTQTKKFVLLTFITFINTISEKTFTTYKKQEARICSVVKVMEGKVASITGKTPRRFHRLTHDRNKIWYYTYLREQY